MISKQFQLKFIIVFFTFLFCGLSTTKAQAADVDLCSFLRGDAKKACQVAAAVVNSESSKSEKQQDTPSSSQTSESKAPYSSKKSKAKKYKVEQCPSGRFDVDDDFTAACKLRWGRDFSEASVAFKALCDQNHAAACYEYAQLQYSYGKSDMNLKGSHASDVIQTFNKSCDLGNSLACYTLGKIHATGNGTKKDFNIAISFMKRACELGDEDSCKITSGSRPIECAFGNRFHSENYETGKLTITCVEGSISSGGFEVSPTQEEIAKFNKGLAEYNKYKSMSPTEYEAKLTTPPSFEDSGWIIRFPDIYADLCLNGSEKSCAAIETALVSHFIDNFSWSPTSTNKILAAMKKECGADYGKPTALYLYCSATYTVEFHIAKLNGFADKSHPANCLKDKANYQEMQDYLVYGDGRKERQGGQYSVLDSYTLTNHCKYNLIVKLTNSFDTQPHTLSPGQSLDIDKSAKIKWIIKTK